MKTAVLLLLINTCMLLSFHGFAVEEAAQSGAKAKSSEHETASSVITFNGGNGCGYFAGIVPDFKLKDATGKSFDSTSLYRERGMVLMVSATNLTQYERQKKWEKYIKQAGLPQDNAPKCVVIEDVSQGHRDKAVGMMRDKARDDSRELFLVDESGAVRRSFGVDQDETVILIVDSSGCVVHHESDEVEPCQEAGQRVARFVRKLAEAARTVAVAVANTDAKSK